MKTVSALVNYFHSSMREAYELASKQYYGSAKFPEKTQYSVYLAFETRCKEHPNFNSKEAAIKIRQIIIAHYTKNQYHVPSAMRTFINGIPEKFKVRGEYDPLTIEE